MQFKIDSGNWVNNGIQVECPGGFCVLITGTPKRAIDVVFTVDVVPGRMDNSILAEDLSNVLGLEAKSTIIGNIVDLINSIVYSYMVGKRDGSSETKITGKDLINLFKS
jgi:hypothetical protein